MRPSFGSIGWLESSQALREIEIVAGDVRDPGLCHELTRGIDVVLHLAALIAIPYSYRAAHSYIATNIGGTFNLCQAALANGCEKFVTTSTSEVYGTARYVPIDEDHPLQPQSPYSASKIGADAMAMSCHLALGLPLAIARPFNTYGPRQSARAIIPTVISQLAAGATQLFLGDLRPTRDFTYVADTCAGIIAIAESDATVGQVTNIGSGAEISIGELARMLKAKMASEAEIVEEALRLRPESSEVFRLWCGNEKLRKLTGFVPGTSLSDGLDATIAWFRQPGNLSRYKPGEYAV